MYGVACEQLQRELEQHISEDAMHYFVLRPRHPGSGVSLEAKIFRKWNPDKPISYNVED